MGSHIVKNGRARWQSITDHAKVVRDAVGVGAVVGVVTRTWNWSRRADGFELSLEMALVG